MSQLESRTCKLSCWDTSRCRNVIGETVVKSDYLLQIVMSLFVIWLSLFGGATLAILTLIVARTRLKHFGAYAIVLSVTSLLLFLLSAAVKALSPWAAAASLLATAAWSSVVSRVTSRSAHSRDRISVDSNRDDP